MWLTNKETGGKFNTDWIDEDYRKKDRQIAFSQAEAQQRTADTFVPQVTTAQTKTLTDIAKRTANLKNEQYYIVDKDGNIVVSSTVGSEGKRHKHEVAVTLGEKREHLGGNVSIHNHPEGGTFSDADLSDFGTGATEIWVSAPEGIYKLRNTKFGTSDQSSGWYHMREDLNKQAFTQERGFTDIRKAATETEAVKKIHEEMTAISNAWVKGRETGESEEVLQGYMKRFGEIETAYRTALKQAERQVAVGPYHDYYTQNAGKYGFEYEFIPKKKRGGNK